MAGAMLMLYSEPPLGCGAAVAWVNSRPYPTKGGWRAVVSQFEFGRSTKVGIAVGDVFAVGRHHAAIYNLSR